MVNQEIVLKMDDNMNIVEDVVSEKPKTPKKKEAKSKELKVTDLPGVGAATAEKLEACGYDNLISIAVASIGQLVDATGVSETVARKMFNSARDSLEMGFESGDALLEKRKHVIKLQTGSVMFNQLLDGVFETGAITECFGEFGSGKTQIGHALAVNCQKDDDTAIAVYIDTENTFRPERIKQLAEGQGMDVEKTLKNILVAKAYNSDHQMLLAVKVEDLIKKEGKNVKIVIVDSLTAHFRAEFIGRGTLAERQQKLNKHMHALSKIADMHNVCVYLTNQVQSDPAQFFGDPTKAVGGHIVAHASTFRIYLRKGKKGSRVAKLIDSPNLPEGEAAFIVATEGL
jgi:DNA repair protein RadA